MSSTSKHRSSTEQAFKAHIASAKRLQGEGKIRQALKAYKDAHVVHPSDKLQARIQKVEVRYKYNCFLFAL